MDTADTGTVSRPCADGCEVSVPSSAKRLAYKSCICKDVHPCVSSCEPSIATCDDNQINPLVPSSILFPSLTLDFKLLINSQNRNRYTLNPIKIKRCLPFFFFESSILNHDSNVPDFCHIFIWKCREETESEGTFERSNDRTFRNGTASRRCGYAGAAENVPWRIAGRRGTGTVSCLRGSSWDVCGGRRCVRRLWSKLGTGSCALRCAVSYASVHQ